MSQLVTDSSGNKHSFPDEATPEMIAQALGVQYSSQSMSAPRHAPMLAEKPSMLRKAWDEVNQRVKEAGTGAYEGLADAAGFAGDLNKIPYLGTAVKLAVPPAALMQYMPTSEQTKDFLWNKVGPAIGLKKTEPTDRLGRYLKEGFRVAAPAALTPAGGSAATMARVGAVSGLAGEGAVDATGTAGTPYEQPVRLAGGLAGAGTGGLVSGAIRPTTGQVLSDATRYMTPQQWAAAQALERDAAGAGTRLTGPEAISQATGGNRALTNLQRVVENEGSQGAPVMDAFMQQRPEGVSAAARHAINPIGLSKPEGAAIATNVQEGANSAIIRARGEVSQATKPHYDAAKSVPVADTDLQPILAQIDQAITDVGPASAAGKRLVAYRDALLPSGQTGSTVGQLDQIYKETRDALKALPTDPNAMQAAVGGIVKPINRALGDKLTQMSADLAYGRHIHGVLTSEKVSPLTKALVGRLAGIKGFEDAASNLMPMTPKGLKPADIQRAVAAIAKEAPEALPEFVRRNLESIFSEATQKNVGGFNQFGGPKYAATVIGNSEQEANLKALIEGLPGGQNAWPGFRKFLEVMQAQGQRAPTGSATSFNDAIKQDLSTGAVQIAISPLGTIKNAWQQFQYGRNAGELARIFTNKESVALIKKLAFEKPNSARAATLVSSILTMSRAAGTESPQQGQ